MLCGTTSTTSTTNSSSTTASQRKGVGDQNVTIRNRGFGTIVATAFVRDDTDRIHTLGCVVLVVQRGMHIGIPGQSKSEATHGIETQREL